MRKSLIASVAVLAALSITTANAADKKKAAPAKSKPVAAAAAPVVAAAKKHNWTGVYAGVNAGAAWNRTSTKFGYGAWLSDPNTIAPGILPSKLNKKDTGFSGGAQIGYNHQIDQLVIGAEVDFQNIGKNSKSYSVLDNGQTVTTYTNSGSQWLSTGRTRIGYAFNDILVYGTGGLAFGQVKSNGSISGVSNPVQAWDGTYTTNSKSENKWGWALGLGAEYALNQNISIKAEYLHYDLGSTKSSIVSTPFAVQTTGQPAGVLGTSKAKVNGDIIRIGLNYKF